MLGNYEKQCATNPDWENARRVHDWRNHVPVDVQEAWATFTVAQQYLLFSWASELAHGEG